MKILIVEDDKNRKEGLSYSLESEGYEIQIYVNRVFLVFAS